MKKNDYLLFLLSVAVLFSMTEPTLAANDIGTIGTNLAAQGRGVASAVKIFSLLIGFCMVVGGLIGVSNAKKQQQPIGGPMTLLILGVVLVSVIAFIGVGSQTFFGSSSGGISDLGI